MRVHHTGFIGPRPLSSDAVDQARQADPNAGSANVAPSPKAAYTPSPQLLQLIALVRSVPEVRADLVEKIAGRLQAGYYQGVESAERTAEAMLAAPEEFP